MTGSKFGTAQSTSFEEIPVIDISTIQTAEGFERIAEKLVHTAKTVGFFYITGHGISEKLIEQVFATSKRFFKLPVAKKIHGRSRQKSTGMDGARDGTA